MKSLLPIVTAFFLLLLSSTLGLGQTVVTYSYTGGVQTWTVPAGVSTATVYCWGGGGGGGGGNTCSYPWYANGGGGGGGACSRNVISISSGQVYNITVGAGGTGGTTGGAGGTSTISGAAGTFNAAGGSGGSQSIGTGTNAGGAGGNTGTGTVFSGGNGSAGYDGTTSTDGIAGTGGGGAGSGGNGNTPSMSCSGTGTGGAGTYPGGNGGSSNSSCGSPVNIPPVAGNVPGGGGSAYYNWSMCGACNGATGGNGQVIVLYNSCATVGGTASASPATVCSGSTSVISVTGYTGGSTFQWQSSPDNSTWSNIGGATSASYTTPALASNTYYQCVVTNGCASNSASALVTVNAASVGGTAAPSPTAVCSGNTSVITLTGNTGTIQWQSSPDNSTWSNIGGATGSTYTTPALASTTYYRAVVTNGVCAAANSSSATVSVATCYTQPINTTATYTLSSCIGNYYDDGGAAGNYQTSNYSTVTFYPSNSSQKLQAFFNSFNTESAPCATNWDWLKIYNGPNTSSPLFNCYSTSGVDATGLTFLSTDATGALTFQWQSDPVAVGTGWFANLTCCSANITGQPSNAAVCSGNSTNFTLVASGSPTYQWQYNNAGTWGNVAAGFPTNASYATPTTATLGVSGAIAAGSYQYRCNVTNGCTISSNTVTLTVTGGVPGLAGISTPSNGATSQCPNSTTSLNWSASANATSYLLYFGTDPALVTGNIVNGTNIGNVLTYNPLPLAVNTTYYWKIVPTNGCGNAAGASIWSFTTGPVCYCTPAASSLGAIMYLTNVTIGTINNTTGNSTSYGNYYGSTTTTMTSGTSATLSLSSVCCSWPLNYGVWIDYNDDGDFADGGESVLTISNSTLYTVAASLSIASGANPGTHRMRIMGDYYAYAPPSDPCATLNYGETEDYKIVIVTPCAAPATQASGLNFTAVGCTQMNVNWTVGNGTKRLVVAKQGSAVAGTPSNNITYSANPIFTNGQIIAANEYVVYNGSGTTVTVTGLTVGATYYFKVFEYDCTPGYEKINTTSPPSGSQATTGASTPGAGPDQYICSPTSIITMAGTGSGNWSMISGPNTPNIVTVGSATTQIGTTTGLVSGIYVFRFSGVCGTVYDDVLIVRQ